MWPGHAFESPLFPFQKNSEFTGGGGDRGHPLSGGMPTPFSLPGSPRLPCEPELLMGSEKKSGTSGKDVPKQKSGKYPCDKLIEETGGQKASISRILEQGRKKLSLR